MALSANRTGAYYKPSGGALMDYPVAVDIIYKGSMVSVNAAGYLVPSTDSATDIWCGIALEEIDNSGGSAGDKNCRVDIGGAIIKLTHTAGSQAQSNVGDIVYVDGDADTDVKANVTNNMELGVIVKVEDDGDNVWVQVLRPAEALLVGP